MWKIGNLPLELHGKIKWATLCERAKWTWHVNLLHITWFRLGMTWFKYDLIHRSMIYLMLIWQVLSQQFWRKPVSENWNWRVYCCDCTITLRYSQLIFYFFELINLFGVQFEKSCEYRVMKRKKNISEETLLLDFGQQIRFKEKMILLIWFQIR